MQRILPDRQAPRGQPDRRREVRRGEWKPHIPLRFFVCEPAISATADSSAYGHLRIQKKLILTRSDLVILKRREGLEREELTKDSSKKANGRDKRGSTSRPFIFVVTVLTPATTETEDSPTVSLAPQYNSQNACPARVAFSRIYTSQIVRV